MKKVYIVGIIIFSIIAIGSIMFFIPVEKRSEIKYEHKFDDGGINVDCYYNAFGIKIIEKE